MARNGDEEQIRPIGVVGPKRALPHILEKVALARVLARQLPRRLVERLGIPIWVHENPKPPLHLLVAPPETRRIVVHRAPRSRRIRTCNRHHTQY